MRSLRSNRDLSYISLTEFIRDMSIEGTNLTSSLTTENESKINDDDLVISNNSNITNDTDHADGEMAISSQLLEKNSRSSTTNGNMEIIV